MKQEIQVDQSQTLAGVSAENLAAPATGDGHSGVAGRELDVLIAERVMEWPMTTIDRSRYILEKGERKAVPRYSTDIAAAMEVVKKMWQAGWHVEMANTPKIDTLLKDHVPAWWVRFINNEDDLDSWSAECDTLPEAVCRAALQATETSEAS